MKTETLTSYLKLLALDGIGVLNARKIAEHFKSIDAIFEKNQSFDSLENPVIKKRLEAAISSLYIKMIEEELRFMKENDIKAVGILESDYPKLLKECADAPIVLFYKGDLSLLDRVSIAIVGTRKITTYGKSVMEKFIDEIKPFTPTLISGM